MSKYIFHKNKKSRIKVLGTGRLPIKMRIWGGLMCIGNCAREDLYNIG